MKKPLRIVWDEVGRSQWEGLLSRVPRSCYMQTWAYGEAVADSTRMRPRRGIVYRMGEPIGLAQAFQALYLFKTYSVTKVLRGPQWLVDDLTDEEHLETYALMQEYFSKSFRKLFQLLPDLEDTSENRRMLATLGLRKALPGYSTSFLDVSDNLETLRTNLRAGWRSSLNFAEKQNLEIEYAQDYHSVEWLLESYAALMKERKFTGPSPDFIRSYLKHSENPYILLKTKDHLAGILIVTNGRSSTYLVGWNSEKGRELKAHHLLLWEGIKKLKQMDIEALDLGGTNMKGAKGITEFKKGMGGQEHQQIGVFV